MPPKVYKRIARDGVYTFGIRVLFLNKTEYQQMHEWSRTNIKSNYKKGNEISMIAKEFWFKDEKYRDWFLLKWS